MSTTSPEYAPDVVWGGQWEHPVCGASGEATWGDEETAYAGHECENDGEVTWSAEWRCDACGATSGPYLLGDDSPTYSDHECGED
ncbi:hypothetical protein GCM10009801_73030 [Streptomyces albiaxialis]|uniref:Uncharacterized protein n=1 Tax=Streptomyces albiaxialis TaxID=329523 RepID=A0ABN2WWS7_9ACTN